MRINKISVLSVILVLSIVLTTAPSAISLGKPDPSLILQEYEKLMDSFSTESILDSEAVTNVIYPYDYAGAYYGDDGLLHICITSSEDRVDFYTGIVDKSLTCFDYVNYSFEYLSSIHDLLKSNMISFDVYDISTIQADNKVYIYTSDSKSVETIKSFLNGKSIDDESFEIIVDTERQIIASSGHEENKDDFKGVNSTNYFRPGDPVYIWNTGSGVSWATVLCNARKTVNGSYVYGFITAAHLWWDGTSAGNNTQSMATYSQSTTDYSTDATFIPFNNSSYGTTARIENGIYPTQDQNYMAYYVTSNNGLENFVYRAFGKTSGVSYNISVLSVSETYYFLDPNTNTYYPLSGIKTSGYSSAGDSGGPLVYVNQFGSYTLLGMTSARDTLYNYVIPVNDIFSALGVSMMGGNY